MTGDLGDPEELVAKIPRDLSDRIQAGVDGALDWMIRFTAAWRKRYPKG